MTRPARIRPAAFGSAILVATCAVLLAAHSPRAAGAGTVFGLVDTGELYASVDGGAQWTIRSTLPVHDAVALSAGSTSALLFLCTQRGSVYRSTDAGVSWSAVGAVPASDVAAMVTRFDSILLVSASGSVFRSADGGATFAPVGAIPASDLAGAAWLGSHFAVTRAGEVYRSNDDGASWVAVGSIGGTRAVGIAALGGQLYALTSTGDVARSSDATGTSWTFVSTLSQSGMSALARAGAELLVSSEAGETAASGNGASWTWRGAIGQLFVRGLGSDDPATTDVVSRVPQVFEFAAPWPNPSRGRVTLLFDLDHEAPATVDVFDPAGRLVARPMVRERIPAGRVTRVWQPEDILPGRYYVRAQVGDRIETRSLVWLGSR